jgi:hypothetical protein
MTSVPKTKETPGATFYPARPWDDGSPSQVPSLKLQPEFKSETTMVNNHSEIEKRLWASADGLRANSKLKSSEYSVPVLGLIFLRYADFKFSIAEKELAGKGSGRRGIGKEDYQASYQGEGMSVYGIA